MHNSPNQFKLIKEETLRIASSSWLIGHLNRTSSQSTTDWDNAHCAYIEDAGQKNLIFLNASSCQMEEEPQYGFKSSFVEYLQKAKPETFKALLFRLHLYSSQPFLALAQLEDGPYRFKKTVSSDGKIIDELLLDTHGLILWKHQLFAILDLFFDDHDKIAEIRKGLMRKRPETEGELKSIQIDKEFTLFDLIMLRSFIMGCYPEPNHKGARLLYEVLAL